MKWLRLGPLFLASFRLVLLSGPHFVLTDYVHVLNNENFTAQSSEGHPFGYKYS